ncbi:MAG: ABC transporter permease [Oscillospiraceae bacterium]|nr:ABC transporter permease [Oscillospiraceae bacterium]
MSNTKANALVSKKFKKRSQAGEIFHHLSKNKGAMAGFIILSLLVLAFLISLFISMDSITAMNARMRFTGPSGQHWFGTDGFGRDLFLRVIYGSRYTLAIGLGAVTFGAIFGITFGSLAGYYGGKLEEIIMRASDVLASIPGILLGMVIVTVLGQSLQNLIIAVGVQATPIYLRMARASTLTVRNHEFVEAARAVGLPHFRIIFTQVLPNGLSPIIVTLTASLGIAIIVGASLSFLGFGVPVPAPEWGAIIADNRAYARSAPWLMSFPGFFIMSTVLAFNLLGDGLRDALDPKLKMR